MLKLDKYDKKLLYELDKKANLPLSVLASKLHRSKQVILYRMKKLEEDGIITGYHAIVDMAKLGYFSFRIYLRFHQTTEEEEKQFVAFVKKNYAQVWTITRMHGKWDFALFLGVKNIMEFHTIWDGVLLQYKPKIKNYNVAVYAPVYNFNRSFERYFIGNKKLGAMKDLADVGVTIVQVLNKRKYLIADEFIKNVASFFAPMRPSKFFIFPRKD